ncbi:TATA element modulatory factor-like isoform X2 [Artemia franciscana]|uniref:TATA element modulatory factor-like isoform X2 n=1 Tax=Artemia franciscana TaxID=6661 RepID=UPI0032D9B9BF
MSWFNTKGFSGLAKTALREAQKTIDRALDINEEDAKTEGSGSTEYTGLTSDAIVNITTLQPVKSLFSSPVGNALWGAFTGNADYEDKITEVQTDATSRSTQLVSDEVIVLSPPKSEKSAILSSREDADQTWNVENGIENAEKNRGWETHSQSNTSDFNNENTIITTQVTAKNFGWCEVKLNEDEDRQDTKAIDLVGEPSIDSQQFESSVVSLNSSSFFVKSKPSSLIIGDDGSRSCDDLKTPSSILTVGSGLFLEELSTPCSVPIDSDQNTSSVGLINSNDPSVGEGRGSQDCMHLSDSSSLTVISPDNDGTLPAILDEESVQRDKGQESYNFDVTQEKEEHPVFDNRSEKTVSSNDSYVRFEHRTKELEIRDSSPFSSERSERTKFRSVFNSGHTSGDEIETATSSDIEVISSPGSRAPSSPNRCFYSGPSGDHIHLNVTSSNLKKGHRRQMSEGSSGGSDDSLASEVEKLMKRISEKNRILEARETKLVELSRTIASIQEENSTILSKLAEAEKQRLSDSENAEKLQQDLTRRLSQMEQKFQQAATEKEALLSKLEAASQELSSKISKLEADAMLQEKEEIIMELRAEGEKLSKQQLQHSTAIKKLRAKEKEDEKLLKIQKEKIEELQKESDRLKKSLSAKEEIERSQIEAVRQLTEAKKAAEKELDSLRARCTEAEGQLHSLREAVEYAQREYEALEQRNIELESEAAQKTLSKEISIRQELQLALEESQSISAAEKSLLLAQLEDLKISLSNAEAELQRKREEHRRETNSLMDRLSYLESSHEESSQSITEATVPLLRQIESLQHSLVASREKSDRTERNMVEKLKFLESEVSRKRECEEKQSVEFSNCLKENRELKNRLETVLKEKLTVETQLESERMNIRSSAEAEGVQKMALEEITALRNEVKNLKENFFALNTVVEEEKEKNRTLQEQLLEKDRSIGNLLAQGHSQVPFSRQSDLLHNTSFQSRTSSPTPSLGRISISEGSSGQEVHTRDPWANEEDVFESGPATPVPKVTTVYEIAHSGFGAATLLETLESQLKLKEGEIMQLQFEMNNGERQRTALANEVVRLTTDNENIHERLAQLEELKTEFEELQVNYDALLTMYGEKVEEAEELRLDLLDVKEAYKIQIDQLTQRG